jgi:hypothetical protein
VLLAQKTKAELSKFDKLIPEGIYSFTLDITSDYINLYKAELEIKVNKETAYFYKNIIYRVSDTIYHSYSRTYFLTTPSDLPKKIRVLDRIDLNNNKRVIFLRSLYSPQGSFRDQNSVVHRLSYNKYL